MLLLVDNGSAYTAELDSLLGRLDCDHVRLEPAKIDLATLEKYDSFVLSGRRKNSRETNKTNSHIIREAVRRNTPLLGICYGAEIAALALGGSIRKMRNARSGMYTVKAHTANEMCSGEIEAYESHAYEISVMPPGMISLASSSECANELVHVRDTRVYATQFHPEKSHDGQALVANFVKRA